MDRRCKALATMGVLVVEAVEGLAARRGDTVQVRLIKARLDLAQARTEVPVRASCLCRREAA